MEEQPIEVNEKEFRAQQAEKLVGFLNKIGAYEYIQKLKLNPETGDEPSFEEFRDFLLRINGILRDIPISERTADGKTVYLEGFDPALVPKQEDKEGLLKEAYQAVGNIQGGDEEYLLPAVVNAVHLFADGNGRTSRVLHTLLQSKSEEEFTKKLQTSVSDSGRYDTADISPALISTDIEKIVLMRHGIQFEDNGEYSPIFPEGFGHLFASIEEPKTPKAKEFMSFRRIDQPYCFISAYEYLKAKDLLSKVTVEIPSGLTLSPLKMEKELTEDDWNEIIKEYYGLKKEHVKVLIDTFVEPHSYKNVDGSMDLRDYFIKKIQERLEKNLG